MIPINLRLEGFTSYREAVNINFTGFDLACISGANGAGKSSILDAITYALYGKARVQNEAIINTASKFAEVTLDFEYENQVYRVCRRNTRGKSTTLDFFIQNPDADSDSFNWKPLTEYTVRKTDAKILNTLRLDYESFVNASFFLQGKADSFATKKPSERKEILSTILGLDQWEVFRKAANEKNRKARSDAKLLDINIAQIQEELDTEDHQKQERKLLESELALLREKTSTQQAQLDAARAQAQLVANQERQLENLVQQVERQRQAVKRKEQQASEKQAALAGYQEKLAQAVEIENAYQKLLSNRQSLNGYDQISQKYWSLERQRAGLDSQIKSYLQSLEREVASLRDEERELQEALKSSSQTNEQLKELADQLAELSMMPEQAELTKQINVLSSQIERLEGEKGSLKARMDELANRRSKVESAKGGACPMCGQDLTAEHRLEIISEINILGKPLGDQFRSNRTETEKLKAEKEELDSQLKKAQQQEAQRHKLTTQQALLQQKTEQLQDRERVWNSGKAARLKVAQAEIKNDNFLPEVRAEIAVVAQQLAELSYDQNAHNQLRQAVQETAAAEETWQELQIARTSSSLHHAELESLQKDIAHEQEELRETEARFVSEAQALREARANLPDSREIEKALVELREGQDSVNRKLGEVDQALATIQTQRERQIRLRAEKETLNEQIRQYAKLETAFGKDGVPAMLIEQALPELETQANLLLARLSDYSMSVSFNPQRAYKDSKRKDMMETLDIVVSDGSGTRDYETYSGGEAFRINFSIRLALSRVLARRAGAKLQTLVIDEGFGNQDAQGRQRLIEAINIVRQDFEKVLIITHLEELKDYFSNRIEVTKGPGGSQVEIILG